MQEIISNDRESTNNAFLEQLDQLTPEQWQALQSRLQRQQAQKHPKLIDLRFEVDLILTRFFVVLMVGPDRRKQKRSQPTTRLTKLGNFLAATLFLISANLLLSAIILLGLYLCKSALGIDLTPGHISKTLRLILH